MDTFEQQRYSALNAMSSVKGCICKWENHFTSGHAAVTDSAEVNEERGDWKYYSVHLS